MSVPVYGSPPDFSGHALEAVRLQGFSSRGLLVPGATVFYLKVAGEWHRVAIDHGTVHWHREESEPKTWSAPGEDWEYPVHEPPDTQELVGKPISSLVTFGEGDSVSVQLLFENGRKLVFAGSGDENAVSAV